MLDNEIQFELKKLESKLYSLLKNYNELKNKTEELNQKNEDIYIKLTLKDLEISKLKNQKQLSGKNEDYLIEKNKLKEELERNINEIEKCIESIKLS
jgi:chromosome segregation ATPase|tara:strand:+ start:1086 stop:1376 length:291 start_codon:yes stop_codon:yes gene_type:complete